MFPYKFLFTSRVLSTRPWLSAGRQLSTAGIPSDDDSKPKPKTKEVTSLRPTTSDSLPILSTRTPTRGETQSVFTLATAEKYLFPHLLEPPLHSRILHDAWWFPKWGTPGKEGEVFVFKNGSFVCWGMGEQASRKFAADIIGKIHGIEIRPLKEAETRALEFVTDPSECSRLQGDLIILGQAAKIFDDAHDLPADLPPMAFPCETLLTRYAFSQALSRSTALSVLEVSLDNYLSSMSRFPHSLEQTGKPGMTRTALIEKLGQLMKFRKGLNSNKENFSDIPDFYWNEPELERYFKSLSDALAVRSRTNSVNEKIDYAGEAQSVLRQLLTESSSHNLFFFFR